MDLLPILITFIAGLAMGAINNVAGGAGVLGLLSFEYACGMPLSIANPTTRISAVAIGLFSFLGYLRSGHSPSAKAWLISLAAIPGAWLGTELALELPDLVFRTYLSLIMLALLWQMLHKPSKRAQSPKHSWLAPFSCFLIGLHLGYAQVGTGLLAILLFTSTYSRDLITVNAAKSTAVILASVTSLLGFSTVHVIEWQPGLWLAAGTAIGSFYASRWAVAKGSEAIRKVVIGIAILTLAVQVTHIVAG